MAVTTTRDERESQKTSYIWDRTKSKLKNKKTGASDSIFKTLLGGQEPTSLVKLRSDLYNQHWNMTEDYINQQIALEMAHVLDGIVDFMHEPWDNDPDSRIPTAVVLSGPDTANHMALCSEIYKKLDSISSVKLVVLSSKNCPNLKVALKTIVAHITEGRPGTVSDQKIKEEEETEDVNEELLFDRRIRYDLSILAEWCRLQELKDGIPIESNRIVVAIADSDSFDVNILNELISMLHLYVDQIPIKLILSVSTSLTVFEGKLPRSLLRMLDGREFHAEIEDSMETLIPIWSKYYASHLLGPKTIESVRTRQNQSMKSTGAVKSALKYAFMAHFFSNPFSIFSSHEASDVSQLTDAHFRAARMLPSFRFHIQELIESNDLEQAGKLMNDNEFLGEKIKTATDEFRQYLIHVTDLVNILNAYFRETAGSNTSRLNIYQQFMNGTFKLSSNELNDNELHLLIMRNGLELSTSLEGITMENLQKFISSESFKDGYDSRIFHEFFVYDNVSLLETVFSPTLRPAIELGLSDPSHYWGSGHSIPHICTLYQMCRESSVYINIFDYFTAFKESLGSPDEKQALAWFLNGVAELKQLGIVRDCKRKFECVEKIAWKGL